MKPDARIRAVSFEPLTELARDALGHMSPEQLLRNEVAMVRSSTRPVSKLPWWKLAAAVLGSAAVVVGALTLLYRSPSEVLTCTVEQGHLHGNHEVEADEGAAPILRFSDGTEVRVAKGATARIQQMTREGAAMVLERGELQAQVVHTAASKWQFHAGPFNVQVTGTAFAVSWNPEQDRFDLRLEHGSVSVSTPAGAEPIALHAGQWLTAHSRGNQVLIRDLTAKADADAAVDGASSSAPPSAADSVGAPSERTPSEPAPSAPAVGATHMEPPARPDSGHHWAAELARGRFEAIVDDARRRGLDDSLAEASGEELWALASAARYTRHQDIARSALLAERKRFGGSRRSREAAFLLGRLAEAARADSVALTWFETYLTESPGGPYESEALGRKMAILQRVQGRERASAIAREYLAKYPNGTYGPAARAMLSSP